MPKDKKKEFFNHLKDESINSLTYEHIEDYFYDYLQKLLEQISAV